MWRQPWSSGSCNDTALSGRLPRTRSARRRTPLSSGSGLQQAAGGRKPHRQFYLLSNGSDHWWCTSKSLSGSLYGFPKLTLKGLFTLLTVFFPIILYYSQKNRCNVMRQHIPDGIFHISMDSSSYNWLRKNLDLLNQLVLRRFHSELHALRIWWGERKTEHFYQWVKRYFFLVLTFSWIYEWRKPAALRNRRFFSLQ